MKNVNFSNQIIIKKGEHPKYLFKLVHGKAYIIGSLNQNVIKLEAPCYINLIQSIFGVPSLKTIRAEDKCQVTRIKLKKQHIDILKEMKQNGYRKLTFPIFQNIPSQFFYELCRHSNQIKLLKNNNFKSVGNHLYFVLEGKFTILSSNSILRVLSLGQGQILNLKNKQVNIETNSFVRLMSVHIDVVAAILGPYYEQLSQFYLKQQKTIHKYQKRNQRLQVNLKKGKQNIHLVPKQFQNPFQVKLRNLESYCRARSSFSQSKNKHFKNQTAQIQHTMKNLFHEGKRTTYSQNNSAQKQNLLNSKTIFSKKNAKSLHRERKTCDLSRINKLEQCSRDKLMSETSQSNHQSHQFTPKYLKPGSQKSKKQFYRFQKITTNLLKKKGLKYQITKTFIQNT